MCTNRDNFSWYSIGVMPELPEVETIVRRLREKLLDRKIVSVEVRRAKSWQGATDQILNYEIAAVTRRAKIIVIDFAKTKYSLIIHLKMTGQLIHVALDQQRTGGGHPTDDWVNQLPSKHTRVVLTLDDGSTLFFNDMRVFGWLKVVTDSKKQAELAKYGPDIIDNQLTSSHFYQGLQRRTQAIKQVIMDGSFIAGVGNIYACDGLFIAHISPTRKARSLGLAESDALLESLRTVVNQGIELGGATIQHYKNVDGLAGGYQEKRQVYAREGEPCLVCGTLIVRIKQGGRSTFYCPKCQK